MYRILMVENGPASAGVDSLSEKLASSGYTVERLDWQAYQSRPEGEADMVLLDSDLPEGQSDTCYVFYPARSSLREAMMRVKPACANPPLLEDGADVLKSLVPQSFQQAEDAAKDAAAKVNQAAERDVELTVTADTAMDSAAPLSTRGWQTPFNLGFLTPFDDILPTIGRRPAAGRAAAQGGSA